jgi:hypothetical protein
MRSIGAESPAQAPWLAWSWCEAGIGLAMRENIAAASGKRNLLKPWRCNPGR